MSSCSTRRHRTAAELSIQGRAQNDATAQYDGLWGHSWRIRVSPSHGASVTAKKVDKGGQRATKVARVSYGHLSMLGEPYVGNPN